MRPLETKESREKDLRYRDLVERFLSLDLASAFQVKAFLDRLQSSEPI